MNLTLVNKTEEFIKTQFQEHPHFSYNDWNVMYNHSVKVKELALKISESIPEADKELLAIAALLHDIGKTYETDLEVLHTEHEKFNLNISEQFINTLNLPEPRSNKLKHLISLTSDSVERKIIKDADTIALYLDKHLYMLFIEWAVKEHLDSSIQRKLNKFEKINFDITRKLGENAFEQMKKDWNEYQQTYS